MLDKIILVVLTHWWAYEDFLFLLAYWCLLEVVSTGVHTLLFIFWFLRLTAYFFAFKVFMAIYSNGKWRVNWCNFVLIIFYRPKSYNGVLWWNSYVCTTYMGSSDQIPILADINLILAIHLFSSLFYTLELGNTQTNWIKPDFRVIYQEYKWFVDKAKNPNVGP